MSANENAVVTIRGVGKSEERAIHAFDHVRYLRIGLVRCQPDERPSSIKIDEQPKLRELRASEAGALRGLMRDSGRMDYAIPEIDFCGARDLQ